MLALALLTLLSAEPARVIAIVPLGDVDKDFLDAAKEALEARVDAEVRIEPKRPLPKDAWYAPRKRWRAEKLLEALNAEPPKDVFKVVGITRAEISTTKGKIHDWGIAGLGGMGELCSVTTTFLYEKHSKTRAVAIRRSVDTVVHELGHTLNMPHCESEGCVMADAKGNAIKSTDRSSGQYCEPCRALAPGGALKPRP